jgi:hypothetical protein
MYRELIKDNAHTCAHAIVCRRRHAHIGERQSTCRPCHTGQKSASQLLCKTWHAQELLTEPGVCLSGTQHTPSFNKQTQTTCSSLNLHRQTKAHTRSSVTQANCKAVTLTGKVGIGVGIVVGAIRWGCRDGKRVGKSGRVSRTTFHV